MTEEIPTIPEEKKTVSFNQRFKEWATPDLTLSLLFCLLGFFMGIGVHYLHVLFNLSSPILVVISLPVFAIVAVAAHNHLNLKEGKSWWASKFIVYLFTWIIIWTILYNLQVVWA
ncbi:MAG: hypothetical protein ABIA21_01285 [Candidatus Aenigmatarchaeota archaeon]